VEGLGRKAQKRRKKKSSASEAGPKAAKREKPRGKEDAILKLLSPLKMVGKLQEQEEMGEKVQPYGDERVNPGGKFRDEILPRPKGEKLVGGQQKR